jgi:hypothetical protein
MSAGQTYVKLATQTLTTNTASITFSGIPQTYTDLVLVMNGGMNTTTGFALSVELNGVSTNSYSATHIFGNGSTVSSGRYTNNPAMYLGAPALNNLNGNFILQFQNYSNTTTNKTVLGRTNFAAGSTWASVGLWRNNAAITSIRLYPETASWLSGSTFTIYGIASSSTPKAIGGTVTTDGTYWIHTFTSSSFFTPLESIDNADYLVVAGGGGSANGQGSSGGGGGGGVRCTVGATGGGGSLETVLNLSAGSSVAVTVGAGGAGTTTSVGGNGSNSTFSTITATGGGGSGGGTLRNGASGGSGGGGGEQGSVLGTGGAGTTNQGFAGAAGQSASYPSAAYGSGGGGGSSAPATTHVGGAGIATSISGLSQNYGGGGGGGSYSATNTGGSGGGGKGRTETTQGFGGGTAGTANTGGGGGGAIVGNGVAGGSGIVIVRYPR